MEHSIEVNIWQLITPEADSYSEVPLEVTFDGDKNGWEVTGYYLDGNPIVFEELLDANPSLAKKINSKIDHYISNYLEDVI